MAYHERALHNYFIPCHGKYIDQRNKCNMRAAYDGKVVCNTAEYITPFLYPDWLYFLWHGINHFRLWIYHGSVVNVTVNP